MEGNTAQNELTNEVQTLKDKVERLMKGFEYTRNAFGECAYLMGYVDDCPTDRYSQSIDGFIQSAVLALFMSFISRSLSGDLAKAKDYLRQMAQYVEDTVGMDLLDEPETGDPVIDAKIYIHKFITTKVATIENLENQPS